MEKLNRQMEKLSQWGNLLAKLGNRLPYWRNWSVELANGATEGMRNFKISAGRKGSFNKLVRREKKNNLIAPLNNARVNNM